MKTCTRCRKPHNGPHKACEPCLRARWATSRCKRVREARQKLGLCRLCGKEAVPGTFHCAYHLEQFQERHAIQYARRRAKGECIHCGSPKAKSRHACPACLAKDRARGVERRRMAKLKAQGLALLKPRLRRTAA